jgi:PhnB protein
MNAVKAMPEGFHTVTPHLVVRDAARAIEFYKSAFGAEEVCRLLSPDGKIMHAEVKIGDSIIMLGNENPEMGCVSPLTIGGTSTTIHLYVPDADSAADRAVKVGATLKMPVAEMFWGDRYGVLEDPFGHKWSVATHVKDMTFEEVRKASEKACAEMAK